MSIWEYKKVTLDLDDSNTLIDKLNELGKEGWQAFQVHRHPSKPEAMFYLKRDTRREWTSLDSEWKRMIKERDDAFTRLYKELAKNEFGDEREWTRFAYCDGREYLYHEDLP